MMTLRPYQATAVDAAYRHLRDRSDNPCIVIPTGGGKTPVIATICRDAAHKWGGRVLVIAHVKELIEQAVAKLKATEPSLSVGVYSAGLGRRDTEHSAIVAGIQSVHKRACDLGAFDLIIVDEAHTIPPDGDGMYRQFLADAKTVNPNVRLIGLTATPYRMASGMICGPDNLLNAVCYEIGVRELIADGYLCPLITKAGRSKADTSALHVRAGEFIASEVEDAMDVDVLVLAACEEIVALTADRQACLIFAAGVRHGEHIARTLAEVHGVECGFVTGNTPDNERADLLARFRGATESGLFTAAPLKYLANVNVLTTGFDAPNIDCVAMLRPTLSPGLYYQMVGRGFRLNPGKADCLILDFGGNVLRHGPVDQIEVKDRTKGEGDAPAKECPQCHSLIAAGYARCPDCGFEFQPPERSKHDAEASDAGILSGQATDTEYDVSDVVYSVHKKRGADADAPRSMRVDYQIDWRNHKSEWICFEHTGYPRHKATAWWKERSPDPVPDDSERAVEAAIGGALAEPTKITVRTITGDKFERIVAYELGPKPEPMDHDKDRVGRVTPLTDEEIPF
jgi:DNA repair protein RadD